MKTWCCKRFQRALNLFPEKGFSIIAFFDESCDYKSFYISAVSLDRELGRAMQNDDISWPVIKDKTGNNISFAVAVEQRFPIDFCPYCGKDLSLLIRKNQKKFKLLASNHALAAQNLFF